MKTSTRPTAVPDPDAPYGMVWFDQTTTALLRQGRPPPAERPPDPPARRRCNWCPVYVKPEQVLHEDLELDDVCD